VPSVEQQPAAPTALTLAREHLDDLAAMCGQIDAIRVAMPAGSDDALWLAAIVDGGAPDVVEHIEQQITALGGDVDVGAWWRHYCAGYQQMTLMRQRTAIREPAWKRDPVEWMAEHQLQMPAPGPAPGSALDQLLTPGGILDELDICRHDIRGRAADRLGIADRYRRAPTPQEIIDVIRAGRFLWSNEAELQAALAEVLTGAGYPVEREVRLGDRDRIDLLVGRVGIEVKVAGWWRDVERQLNRYRESDGLDALILVTARAQHLRIAAGTRDGAPTLYVHQLQRSGL